MQIARLKSWLVPALIFLMAAGILVAIIGNRNSWASERAEQETDGAYVRADLILLSTNVSGVVAKVLVGDYQTVQAADLLVRLRDDDFQAQVARPKRPCGDHSRELQGQSGSLAGQPRIFVGAGRA